MASEVRQVPWAMHVCTFFMFSCQCGLLITTTNNNELLHYLHTPRTLHSGGCIIIIILYTLYRRRHGHGKVLGYMHMCPLHHAREQPGHIYVFEWGLRDLFCPHGDLSRRDLPPHGDLRNLAGVFPGAGGIYGGLI